MIDCWKGLQKLQRLFVDKGLRDLEEPLIDMDSRELKRLFGYGFTRIATVVWIHENRSNRKLIKIHEN